MCCASSFMEFFRHQLKQNVQLRNKDWKHIFCIFSLFLSHINYMIFLQINTLTHSFSSNKFCVFILIREFQQLILRFRMPQMLFICFLFFLQIQWMTINFSLSPHDCGRVCLGVLILLMFTPLCHLSLINFKLIDFRIKLTNV